MIVKTPKDIGALIRDARRRAKVSQVELARRVGSTQGWISEVENGKASAEIGKVLKVLVALGLTLDAQEAPMTATGEPEPEVAVPAAPKKPQPASSGIPYDINDVLAMGGMSSLPAGQKFYRELLKADSVPGCIRSVTKE